VLIATFLACGVPQTETYEVTGVVQKVDATHQQLKIAHDDIPGFMPAMTMNFDVADAALIEGIEPGYAVRFDLERSATTLRITSIEVTKASVDAHLVASGAPEPEIDLAPDFMLTDHRGEPFTFSDLRGKAVLLAFIYTRCPGPCPILTAAHVDLQRRLGAEIAGRTHFVSVSLDPEYDTSERLAEYGKSHGADLEGWTFLTGTPDEVQKVVDAYHIGTIRQPDGSIGHQVVTFLIDPQGQVSRRYLGLEHPPRKILEDLEETLGAESAS
jgi:protein SCO1/2